MTALANVFMFFSLLPFISPIPVRSDVQLPAFVLAVLIIGIDVLKGRFRLALVDVFFLAVAIWSLCFVLPGGTFTMRERGGLLAAFTIYYVVKKHAFRCSYRTLFLAIFLNLSATLIQLLSQGFYEAWAPYIVRTVKEMSVTRGLSGLSAEPGILATIALTHALLAFYYRKYANMPPGLFWTSLAMAATTLFLSKSATGFVFLFILCGIAVLYMTFNGMTARRWVGLTAAVGIILAVLLGPFAESRGGAVIITLAENPGRVVSDGSVQERIRCLAVGVLSLIHYPLGAGGGTFPEVALEMQKRYTLQRVFSSAAPSGIVGVLNAGGLYLVEMGILYIFFVAIIVGASFQIEVIHLMMLWLALMFLVIAGSITSPLTWLLLGITARKKAPRKTLRPALAA